eukprot:TRINITY_DN4009_c0_g1_i1.p1 TRINITY_DN4009_c0_g1~~TRINITY_DN4009_c0_g1_i1.p1  ORF type:complete len:130 (+),score=3.80 TRINITY_DN4009_c0_g1_i1:56-445(+)
MAESPYTPGMTPMSTPYARAALDGRELVNPVSLELMDCDTPVNDSFNADHPQMMGSTSVSSPILPSSPSATAVNPGQVGMVPIRAMSGLERHPTGAPVIPSPVLASPTPQHAMPLHQCASNPTLATPQR